MNLFDDFNIEGTKSLETLGGFTVDPNAFPSSLIQRVSKAAKVPLERLSAEEIRTLLTQGIQLQIMVPVAICFLSQDPLAGGDMEPGALMRSLFQFVPNEYWNDQPNLLLKAKELLQRSYVELLLKIDSTTDSDEISFLSDAKENFESAAGKGPAF